MKIASLLRALTSGACSFFMWATPSEARFLQVDPVGYKDQFNLYAYVRNDPLNATDPSGNQEVRINPDGSRTIIYTVRLTGPGAVDGRAMRSLGVVASQIRAPAGEAAVRVVVREDATGLTPDTRTFDLSPGVDHVTYNNGQGQGIDLNTRMGHIDSTRRDVGPALMHDTVHPGRPGVEAVSDQWRMVPDASGTLRHVPDSGFEGNIMGTTAGRELNNSQVNQIQANAYKVCNIDARGIASGPGC